MVDWNYIDEKYPSRLDKNNMSKEEYRKERTNELYSYLPQTTLEEREQYTDIRDAVIELNYTFFGYVATHTFINNSSVSYEDKFQSALLHFCEMWAKYKYAAKYRTDLSFSVFFKPRVGECIERELNQVKYSLRRDLCMKAGKQLGKHWGKVTYEDLKDVRLPESDMTSLQAIFGSMYVADLETHAMFIESEEEIDTSSQYYSDNYNSLTEMLMHEMCEKERILTDSDILNLAQIVDIPFANLKELMPSATEKLYNKLHDNMDLVETFK